MRKIVVVLAAVAAMPVTVASAANNTWTGLYVGGQFGGGWGTSQTTNVTATSAEPAGTVDGPTGLSGALGGLYAGYNYQMNQYLVGIDGDFSWSSVDGDSTDIGLTNGHTLSHHTYMDWLTSVTGRVGYTNDNWLLFAKGGWAWAQFHGTTNNSLGAVNFGVGSSSEVRDGWTVGAGLEYAVTSHVTLKLEYDYVGFATANYTSTDVSATGVVTMPSKSTTSSLSVFKAGGAYRF